MADNKIRHRLSLEGDDEVKNKLKDVGEAGKKALEGIHESFEKAGESANNHGDLLEKLKQKALGKGERESGGGEGDHESRLGKIKEHVGEAVGAAAEGAELEIGGAFAGMLGLAKGGVIGFTTGLAAFIGGALEKLGGEINDRVSRLWSFTGSLEKGKQANENLNKVADELKLPASGLSSAFEQLQRTDSVLQPKDQLGAAGISETLKSLFQGAAADRVPFDKAAEAIPKFLADLRENGRLTSGNAKETGEVLPKFMERLIGALQDKFGQQSYYTTPQVLSTARGLGPEFKQLAGEQGPSSIGDAYTTLKASTEKLAEEVAGGHVIASTLETTAKFIDSVADGVKKVKEASEHAKETQAPTVSPEKANKLRDERGFGPVQGPQSYDFLRAPPSTQAPEDDPAGIRLLKSLFGVKGETYAPEKPVENKDASQTGLGAIAEENAAHAEASAAEHEAARVHGESAEQVAKLGEAAGGAQKKLDELNKFEKQLPAIGAHLQTEQAKIDNQFAPDEEASKLGHDELAVENARLQQQQARLAQTEAGKNQDLSRLAPEQASENLASAESRANKARHALNQALGLADNFDPGRAKLEDLQNDVDASDTAVKRAKIEKKYAYLEPAKAALAADKAETDIRSADYLRKDTDLKLAKDDAGQSLSPEVASLRYAQAMLEEQKAVSKLNGEEVGVLKDILSAIERGGLGGGDKKGREEKETGPSNGQGERGAAASSVPSSTYNPNESGGFRRVRPGVWSKINPDGTTDGDIFKSDPNPPAVSHPPGFKEGEAAPAQAPGFDREADRAEQLNALKEDFDSQDRLNKNIARQNGGKLQKVPRGGISGSYPPAVAGTYDPETQGFVPSQPNNNYDFAPNNNDYWFAGKKNPFPYQPGISTPLSFGPHSEAEPGPPQQPAQDNQQLAGLSDVLRSIVQGITDAANKVAPAQNLNAGPDTQAVGVRADSGEDAKQDVSALGGAAEDAKGNVSDFASAVSEAASSIRSRKDDDGGVHAATGGHITGPGTSTSDSIPAMLSHDEFVVNASQTRKHMPLLKAVNDGDFASYAKKHFSNGGLVDIPRFRDGGPVTSLPSPQLAPSAGNLSSDGGSHAGYHAIDMRTGFGDYRVLAPEHVARSMSSAARNSQNAQTGQRPSWYRGK